MTEIEIYKQTLKAVHNEYVKILATVEKHIVDRANKSKLPEFMIVQINEHTHMCFEVSIGSLKNYMDHKLEEINNEN